MYTIELTVGPGWDAPTLQARVIKTTVDPAKVAALAAAWLHEVHKTYPMPRSPMAGGSSMGLGAG